MLQKVRGLWGFGCSGFVFGLPGLQVLQNVLLIFGLQGSSAPGSPKSARPVLLPTIHVFLKESKPMFGYNLSLYGINKVNSPQILQTFAETMFGPPESKERQAAPNPIWRCLYLAGKRNSNRNCSAQACSCKDCLGERLGVLSGRV